MTRWRAWTGRVAVALAVWLTVVAAAGLTGNGPQVLLLALAVAAAAGTVWLCVDSSDRSAAPGSTLGEDLEPVRPAGEDARQVLLTRVLDDHLTAREAGGGLRRQLLDLADQRLVARHGVSSRADLGRATTMLGPELTALAEQHEPYPRLTVRQIDLLLTRIEAL